MATQPRTPDLQAQIAILFLLNCTDDEIVVDLEEAGISTS
jgi:hypothetical protein